MIVWRRPERDAKYFIVVIFLNAHDLSASLFVAKNSARGGVLVHIILAHYLEGRMKDWRCGRHGAHVAVDGLHATAYAWG